METLLKRTIIAYIGCWKNNFNIRPLWLSDMVVNNDITRDRLITGAVMVWILHRGQYHTTRYIRLFCSRKTRMKTILEKSKFFKLYPLDPICSAKFKAENRLIFDGKIAREFACITITVY